MYIHVVQLTTHVFVIFDTEYVGNVPAEKREEVITQLNKESNRLVQVCMIFIISSIFKMCHTMYVDVLSILGGNSSQS